MCVCKTLLYVIKDTTDFKSVREAVKCIIFYTNAKWFSLNITQSRNGSFLNINTILKLNYWHKPRSVRDAEATATKARFHTWLSSRSQIEKGYDLTLTFFGKLSFLVYIIALSSVKATEGSWRQMKSVISCWWRGAFILLIGVILQSLQPHPRGFWPNLATLAGFLTFARGTFRAAASRASVWLCKTTAVYPSNGIVTGVTGLAQSQVRWELSKHCCHRKVNSSAKRNTERFVEEKASVY